MENCTNLPKLGSISILGANIGRGNRCSATAALACQASPGCYDWHVSFSLSTCVFTEVKSLFWPTF